MFITERLISLVAPHTCLLCEREGSVLCDWCKLDAVAPLPSRCYKCHKLTADYAVCDAYRRTTKLRHVWVSSEYLGVAKELLRQFKFERKQAAATPIADLMNETIPWLQKDTIIVPVPTATSRRRERGYDQAELIAKILARARGLHCIGLLGRTGQTRQVGAKRMQRKNQLKEAFWSRKAYLVKGASIVLIDDIVTTGATLEAAAAVLKQAGAKSVNAAVFAQKQ